MLKTVLVKTVLVEIVLVLNYEPVLYLETLRRYLSWLLKTYA